MNIHLSEEQVQKFYDNGYTQEDIRAAIETAAAQGLSEQEIMSNINSQIAKFPSVEQPQTQQSEQPQEAVKAPVDRKGIDLTPSGLIKSGGANIAAAIATPFEAAANKENLVDAFNSVKAKQDAEMKDFYAQHPSQKIGDALRDFAFDMYSYGKLPFVKTGKNAGVLKNIGAALANTGIQGTGIGALEGLKNGDVGRGMAQGTTIAGLLNSLPVAGKIAGLAGQKGLNLASKLAQLEPETMERVLQPDSIALDLSKGDADKLADATTQRLRDAYNALKMQKGDAVAQETQKLNNLENQINVNDLLNDISDVYGKYNYGRLNPAKNLEGGTGDYLAELLTETAGKEGTISPYELLGAKRQIGEMTNWDIADAKTKNKILEQIYGKFNSRLNELSPELAAANKDYAKLYDMLGERSRLRTILNPKTDIETATSKLKKYKSTNANIYDLENQLVNELGEQPFLNKIDDVNAALDLAKKEGTGLGGISGMIKTIATKPALKAARKINQLKESKISELLNPLRKYITPAAVEGTNLMLYGGISNTDDN